MAAKTKIATPDMFGGYSDGQIGFTFAEPASHILCMWGMCGNDASNRVEVRRKDGHGTTKIAYCSAHVGLAVTQKHRVGWETVTKI